MQIKRSPRMIIGRVTCLIYKSHAPSSPADYRVHCISDKRDASMLLLTFTPEDSSAGSPYEILDPRIVAILSHSDPSGPTSLRPDGVT